MESPRSCGNSTMCLCSVEEVKEQREGVDKEGTQYLFRGAGFLTLDLLHAHKNSHIYRQLI